MWNGKKKRARFKVTVPLDGFIVEIKANSICCGFKLTDTIIYLCKMRGTFVTRRTHRVW